MDNSSASHSLAKFGIDASSAQLPAAPIPTGVYGAGSAYIPSLKLLTSSSNPVKRRLAGYVEGHFVHDKADKVVEDLGTAFEAWPISVKHLAVNNKDPKNVITSEDFNSALFQEIKAKADAPQSKDVFYGPVVLLYVPAVDKMFSMMFASKSARNTYGRSVEPFIAIAPLHFTSKVIESKDYVWTAVEAEKASEGLAMPSPEQVQAALAIFHKPAAPADDSTGDR